MRAEKSPTTKRECIVAAISFIASIPSITCLKLTKAPAFHPTPSFKRGKRHEREGGRAKKRDQHEEERDRFEGEKEGGRGDRRRGMRREEKKEILDGRQRGLAD